MFVNPICIATARLKCFDQSKQIKSYAKNCSRHSSVGRSVPFCGAGFEFQAQYLSTFLDLNSWSCYTTCYCEKNEIKKKGPGLAIFKNYQFDTAATYI